MHCLGRFKAVHLGHLDVEEDEVVVLAHDAFERFQRHCPRRRPGSRTARAGRAGDLLVDVIVLGKKNAQGQACCGEGGLVNRRGDLASASACELLEPVDCSRKSLEMISLKRLGQLLGEEGFFVLGKLLIEIEQDARAPSVPLGGSASIWRTSGSGSISSPRSRMTAAKRELGGWSEREADSAVVSTSAPQASELALEQADIFSAVRNEGDAGRGRQPGFVLTGSGVQRRAASAG